MVLAKKITVCNKTHQICREKVIISFNLCVINIFGSKSNLLNKTSYLRQKFDEKVVMRQKYVLGLQKKSDKGEPNLLNNIVELVHKTTVQIRVH